MTSIKTQKYSTHTNQHKSAALYLQLRLALPTGPAACREGWERGSATAAGRGNEAGRDRRKNRWEQRNQEENEAPGARRA